MAIRIPEHLRIGASEIRLRDPDLVYSMSRAIKIDANKKGTLVWEQTTFVDCNGKAFYDVNGVPFQGKK